MKPPTEVLMRLAVTVPLILASQLTVRLPPTMEPQGRDGGATLGQYPKQFAETADHLIFQLTSSFSIGDTVPIQTIEFQATTSVLLPASRSNMTELGHVQPMLELTFDHAKRSWLFSPVLAPQ